MKKHLITLAWACTLLAAPAFVVTQQMDPNVPGMQHDVEAADAQGVGVVKVIDTAKGTITLQHEAITAIAWPAMTMPFEVASPDLLKVPKVGDKVKFILHTAGLASTMTSITVQH
ncbi:MAG TPA: copper-binding protein [Rhodanobacter sp.]